MDIATKLSWEIVALNDRNAEGSELLAAEIAYGVALTCDGVTSFHEVMNSIVGQVTDTALKTCLMKIVVRVTK